MKRKHFFNESYFNNINTEEKAYYLGFLMADGWIMKNTVALALKDVPVLEGLKHAINGTTLEIKKKKNCKGEWNIYALYINSKTMVKDLNNWGIKPNKYLRTEIPSNLNDELVRHFIRGYFDGDGCIYNRKFKQNKYQGSSLTITSSSDKILDQIQTFFLKKRCLKRKNNYIINKKTYSILKIENREEIVNCLSFLYNESHFYLHRKYAKFLEIPTSKPSQKKSYRGVFKNWKKYQAVLTHNKTKYYLGQYSTQTEAAIAYNQKVKELGLSEYFLNKIN